MYCVIRRYKPTYENTSPEEAARLVEEEFVPRVSQIPGFVAYYAMTPDHGELVSISIFKNREGAEASVQEAAQWIQEIKDPALAQAFAGVPEVIQGEVRVHY